MYDHVISLGATCTPAWQIRHYFKQEKAFVFDWLVTPWETVLDLIGEDFRGFVSEDNVELSSDGTTVRNRRFPVLHHHDFHRDGNLIAEDWKKDIPSVVQKYEFLANRWNEELSKRAKVLFVRHEGRLSISGKEYSRIDGNDADGLCKLIADKYPLLDFNVLFVTALSSSPTDHRAINVEIDYANDSDWPNPEDNWKGKTSGWQAVFREITQG